MDTKRNDVITGFMITTNSTKPSIGSANIDIQKRDQKIPRT